MFHSLGGIFLHLLFCAAMIVSAAPGYAQQTANTEEKQKIRSGTQSLTPSLRAVQKDGFANPGYLSLDYGAWLWQRKSGKAGKSCAHCHNEAKNSMAGVAARYPAYKKDLKRPIDLAGQINHCRQKFLQADPWSAESAELTALTAYVRHQSAGREIVVKTDGAVQSFYEAGRTSFFQKRGQLNISCAQCHNDNVGKTYGALPLSQGHSNAYPAYLIASGKMQSLHQRFQMCNRLVRAEPDDLGSQTYINLELYLAQRAMRGKQSLKIETPGLRR